VFNLHGTCSICAYGTCHPVCAPEEEDEETQLAYQSVIRALEEGDFEAVATLAPKLTRFVTFNADRDAVQVLDCDRSRVVASLPLGWFTE